MKRLQWVKDPAPDLWGFPRDFVAANKLGLAKYVGWVALTMGVIPVAIYFATYIPYILQGDGSAALKLLNWNHANHGWGRVVAWQSEMWGYHANLNATHPYSSPWWSWPIMLRPTWYYFHDWKDTPGMTGVSGVWAIGNAFIWWSAIPALLYACFLAWRDAIRALGVCALLGLGLWIMWGVQPRPLLYMHYMFETIPFACIALAYIGYLFWYGHLPGEAGALVDQQDPLIDTQAAVMAVEVPAEGAASDPFVAEPLAAASAAAAVAVAVEVPVLKQQHRRLLVVASFVLIAFWFVFYYPLLAAVPVPWPFYNWHVWYGRVWI